jgi:hypothetical protein
MTKGDPMDQHVHYKINAPHIVHEIFEDKEAAIINLKSGNYYSLDPVGAFVWSHIDSGAAVGEIVQEVLAHYEGDVAEVSHAIAKFIDVLQAEELITIASDRARQAKGQAMTSAANGNGAKTAFTAPVLERYNDMQELLLLDPIHEVDETGWPNRKPEN